MSGSEKDGRGYNTMGQQEATEAATGPAAVEETETLEDRGPGGRFGQHAVVKALTDNQAIGISHMSKKQRGDDVHYILKCTYKVGTFFVARPKQFPHLVIDARMNVHEELLPRVNQLRGEKRQAELMSMVLEAIGGACDIEFSGTADDVPTLHYQYVLTEDDERKLGRAVKEALDAMVRAIIAVHYNMAAKLGVKMKTPWG